MNERDAAEHNGRQKNAAEGCRPVWGTDGTKDGATDDP